jgi:putative (di)nucleoside polyphosphate hydrolase
MTNSKLPFRPNVCLFIYNKDRKFFLGERLASNNLWQLPQGGVEDDGDLIENAIREAVEELGLKEASLVSYKATLNTVNQYTFDNPPNYAKNRWQGQRQNYCLLEFLGENSDIMLDYYHAEFSDYRWVDLDEIQNLAEPKRVIGYQKAISELKLII